MKQKIYPLQGDVQHYVWGGRDYLGDLLNCSKEQPNAEYWLGAHSSLPSRVFVDEQWQPLDSFLQQNPDILGQKSRATFGDNLPFLLKILDVADPLSIQLHPTKIQAEQGFARENQQGIALNDPMRTYKDDNHKPEMMLALSEFWLLHGFKAKSDILAILAQYPSLASLQKKLENSSVADFYAFVMQADQMQLHHWLMPIVKAAQADFDQGLLKENEPTYWVLFSMQRLGITEDKLDAGLLSFYLFNLVHLHKGESIFQGAGIPHAYLRGQNIELMANSDNVIRGGLTPKFVNIPALVATVDCQAITPKVGQAMENQTGFLPLTVDVPDFALIELRWNNLEKFEHYAEQIEILLVMQGELQLTCGDECLTLKAGQTALISADTSYQVQGVKTGFGVVATVP